MIDLRHGDCREVMRTLADASVDAVVCDPPYELGFMGKGWDKSGVAYDVEVWSQCLRVLKPGGHLLAFGGSRTYHRMACAIEDAGFEIRDMLSWNYGSGFPKSLNVGKKLDATQERCTCDSRVRDVRSDVDASDAVSGCTQQDMRADLRGEADRTIELGAESSPDDSMRNMRDVGSSTGLLSQAEQADLLQHVLPREGARTPSETPCCERQGSAVPGEGCERCAQRELEGRRNTEAAEGELHGRPLRSRACVGAADGAEGRLHDGTSARDGADVRFPADSDGSGRPSGSQSVEQRTGQPAPVSDERGSQARGAWPVCGRCGKPMVPEGLGTGLKPAHEPICLARKPLKGTVAANVLAFGTGALNIDGCRVECSDELSVPQSDPAKRVGIVGSEWQATGSAEKNQAAQAASIARTLELGRWPANLIHDGSDEVVALFPQEAGAFAPVRGTEPSAKTSGIYGPMKRQGEASQDERYAESGGTNFAMKPGARRMDEGSAARFFYTAKASRYDRNDGCDGLPTKALNWSSGEQSPGTFQSPNTDRTARNHHPTVKPTDLMRYLCRLVTPKGGLILDPFMGSGSTLKAAELEGFSAIGIELNEEYIEIARRRIASDAPLLREFA